jgi:uncharacterized membrane protein
MTDETTRSRDPWGIPLAHIEPGKRVTFLGFLRSRFVTGLLVAFPVVVSLFFARFLFNLLDRWVDPITVRLVGHKVVGVGAGVALAVIFILGLLGHNVLGRRLLRFGDVVMAKVPVIRAVYSGAREVTRAFSGSRTKNFRRVVLVPFSLSEAYAVAFVTAEFETLTPEGPRRMVAVFMPTTPNPTTGFYLIYPADRVMPTSMTVEEAARMVISGGLVTPDPASIFARFPTGSSA